MLASREDVAAGSWAAYREGLAFELWEVGGPEHELPGVGVDGDAVVDAEAEQRDAVRNLPTDTCGTQHLSADHLT